MKSTVYGTASQFLDATGEFLERNEAVNNLLLGLSNMLVQKKQRGESTAGHFLYSVETDEGAMVLVVLITDKNLIVYGDGTEQTETAIQTAIADIRRLGLTVPGVIGPTPLAHSFALAWASQMKLEPVVHMNQLIYRLDKVNDIPYASGQLRKTALQDHDTIAGWIYEFAESVNEGMTRQEAANKALEFIRDGSVYIWIDGDRPVSMARSSRPTRNGIVLNYVYTPPQWIRQGYASSCVAALSRRLLDEGYRFCTLYTDAANPTSNHIYTEIGYRPVQDSIHYRFK